MSDTFSISEIGLKLIKAYEGYRAEERVLSSGARVVGFGHSVADETKITLTEEDADALLRADLEPIETLINDNVYAAITQSQFDALCSLAFSIGRGPFMSSGILHAINQGRTIEAASMFDVWRLGRIDGKTYVVDALVRRRTAEKALFLRPTQRIAKAPRHELTPVADEDFASRQVEGPVYEDKADFEPAVAFTMDTKSADENEPVEIKTAALAAAAAPVIFADEIDETTNLTDTQAPTTEAVSDPLTITADDNSVSVSVIPGDDISSPDGTEKGDDISYAAIDETILAAENAELQNDIENSAEAIDELALPVDSKIADNLALPVADNDSTGDAAEPGDETIDADTPGEIASPADTHSDLNLVNDDALSTDDETASDIAPQPTAELSDTPDENEALKTLAPLSNEDEINLEAAEPETVENGDDPVRLEPVRVDSPEEEISDALKLGTEPANDIDTEIAAELRPEDSDSPLKDQDELENIQSAEETPAESPIAAAAAEVSERLDALIDEKPAAETVMEELPESLVEFNEPVKDVAEVSKSSEPVAIIDELTTDDALREQIVRESQYNTDRYVEYVKKGETQRPANLWTFITMIVFGLVTSIAGFGINMKGSTGVLGENGPFITIAAMLIGVFLFIAGGYYLIKALFTRK